MHACVGAVVRVVHVVHHLFGRASVPGRERLVPWGDNVFIRVGAGVLRGRRMRVSTGALVMTGSSAYRRDLMELALNGQAE